MNKIILSILLAFTLVISVVNAEVTVNNVDISVVQGQKASDDLTLTTGAFTITNVSFQIEGGELKNAAGNKLIPDDKITFTPLSFSSIANGSTQNIAVEVDTNSDVLVDTYTGKIVLSYVEDGTITVKKADMIVTVSASNVGAQLSVPAKIDYGDEFEREENTSIEFVVENSGSIPLTAMTYTLPSMGDDWEISVSNFPTSLASGAKQTATMHLEAPKDADAELVIGTMVIKAQSSEGEITKNIEIAASPENNLEISDIEVDIEHRDGDNWDKYDFEDDEEDVSEEVFRGDIITITIDLDNNGDTDMDNVEVELDAEDSEFDYGDDQEVDIKDGDDATVEFEFEVPGDADTSSSEDVYITVTAEDDDGAEHIREFRLTFEIDVENDMVIINSIEFASTPRCGETARLEIEIENVGDDDQEEAAVRIEFPEWNMIDWERDIEIDSEDDDLIIFSVEIPEDAKGSSYVEVEAYVNRDEDTDDDSLDFLVSCGTVVNDDEDDDNGGIVVVPGDNDQTGNDNGTTPTGGIVAVGKESFFDSTGYLVLLSVLVVILIVIIVSLILMSRK